MFIYKICLFRSWRFVHYQNLFTKIQVSLLINVKIHYTYDNFKNTRMGVIPSFLLLRYILTLLDHRQQ